MLIGTRIQELRKSRGLTLSDLAEKSGVAKSYLSAIERSIQKNPSIAVLEKLASVLHVSVQTILLPTMPPTDDYLDPDWVELAREAMSSGISKEQFREYMEFQKWRREQSDN